MPCRILVLISGNGSNLQAIIDACAHGDISGDIVGVICNVPDAYGLVRAQKSGIPTTVLDHKAFADRSEFNHALLSAMNNYQPDLVVLAGFMRILSEEIVNQFLGRMINIHPSLLPKYPGLKTHQRALDAGDNIHGATVHFVTPELDGGPAIAQSQCAITANDTPESLAARVHVLEHALFPKVIAWYAADKLRLIDGKTHMDGQFTPCQLIQQ